MGFVHLPALAYDTPKGVGGIERGKSEDWLLSAKTICILCVNFISIITEACEGRRKDGIDDWSLERTFALRKTLYGKEQHYNLQVSAIAQ